MTAQGDTPAQPALVVLVNNELALLSYVTRALEQVGLRVLAFADAREALAAPEMAAASLLVTDCHNPPLHGLGLWTALRAAGVTTPVAFLSAHADDMEARFAEAEERPVAYFSLPYSPRRLVEDITALVRRAQPLAS